MKEIDEHWKKIIRDLPPKSRRYYWPAEYLAVVMLWLLFGLLYGLHALVVFVINLFH